MNHWLRGLSEGLTTLITLPEVLSSMDPLMANQMWTLTRTLLHLLHLPMWCMSLQTSSLFSRTGGQTNMFCRCESITLHIRPAHCCTHRHSWPEQVGQRGGSTWGTSQPQGKCRWLQVAVGKECGPRHSTMGDDSWTGDALGMACSPGHSEQRFPRAGAPHHQGLHKPQRIRNFHQGLHKPQCVCNFNWKQSFYSLNNNDKPRKQK